MNERIKEFRFKAAEYANELKPVGLMRWNEIRDLKFAELILAECIDISDELKSRYHTSRKLATEFEAKNVYGEGETACDKLKLKIKEHFGIE